MEETTFSSPWHHFTIQCSIPPPPPPVGYTIQWRILLPPPLAVIPSSGGHYLLLPPGGYTKQWRILPPPLPPPPSYTIQWRILYLLPPAGGYTIQWRILPPPPCRRLYHPVEDTTSSPLPAVIPSSGGYYLLPSPPCRLYHPVEDTTSAPSGGYYSYLLFPPGGYTIQRRIPNYFSSKMCFQHLWNTRAFPV